MKNKNIFIAITLTLTLIFILVLVLESRLEYNTREKLPLKKYVKVLPTSHIIANNLSKNKNKILDSLNYELNQTNQVIDTEVDKLFKPVFDNIDNFLDEHYSVLGEYENLKTTVLGDINQMIADKLFKKDFSDRFKKQSDLIIKAHTEHTKNYLNDLHKYVFEGVNLTKHKIAIKNLKAEIDATVLEQSKKLTKLSDTVSLKVAKKISAQISTSSFAKSATKSGVKIVASSATAGTGAVAAGIICGPFAWICSPIAAGFIMISTDAAVIAGDELITREKFKKEIINVLDTNIKKLKNSYKKACRSSTKKISKQAIKKYKKI